MSEKKLNFLELKEKLLAEDLYEPGMNFIHMEQVYYLHKCKQAIKAEGLYENGMSDQDVQDLYNTLKKSKESAGNDKEYRDILNRTETNCNNIDMLIEDSNMINNDETVEDVDVTTVQTGTRSVSPKPVSVSKSFSLFKRNNEKQSIKNINVLMEVKTNHPLLKLPNMKYSNASLLYYHQKKILELPLLERAEAISQYLLNMYKYRKNDTNYEIKWSKPILPQHDKPFNGDFCVDFIPDTLEEIDNEKVDSFKIDVIESPHKDNVNTYVLNRPKRVVKRKTYIGQMTDDEDDFTTIKKTKNNDDSSNENTPDSKWLKSKRRMIPNTPPTYLSTASDRMNKIFDKLKWDNNPISKIEKKSTAQTLQETLNLSDSDEEIFPSGDIVTTVNIHKEEDQAAATKSKNAKTSKTKKTSPKKRAAYNKLATQKKSATKENESPEIPTSNFYGQNKNTDVDESNNNKSDNSEEVTTNCPICNRSFPVSKIEVHASNCMQYEGTDAETYCDICNEMIPDKKFRSHRYECQNKITAASTIDKPVPRSLRSNGFLCQICDKYISDMSQILHASNCIAKG